MRPTSAKIAAPTLNSLNGYQLVKKRSSAVSSQRPSRRPGSAVDIPRSPLSPPSRIWWSGSRLEVASTEASRNSSRRSELAEVMARPRPRLATSAKPALSCRPVSVELSNNLLAGAGHEAVRHTRVEDPGVAIRPKPRRGVAELYVRMKAEEKVFRFLDLVAVARLLVFVLHPLVADPGGRRACGQAERAASVPSRRRCSGTATHHRLHPR